MVFTSQTESHILGSSIETNEMESLDINVNNDFKLFEESFS
jgi:hypothetical protein